MDGLELKNFIHISSSCFSNSSSTYIFLLLKKLLGELMKRLKELTPSCCYISYFTVSVTPSIDTPESSNDFMILIIYDIYIFIRNK